MFFNRPNAPTIPTVVTREVFRIIAEKNEELLEEYSKKKRQLI